jgi:hypothetical protein
LGVGDAFFVKHEGLVWGGGRVNSWSGVLTLKRGTWRGRGLHDFIGLSIGGSHVVCICAGNIAVAGSGGVDLFDNKMGDGSATRGDRSVWFADAWGAAASGAIGDNLNLVGYGILGSDVVGCGAGDFAVSGLVVYFLDTGDGDRQGTITTSKSRRVWWGAFGGIREVVIGLFGFWRGVSSWLWGGESKWDTSNLGYTGQLVCTRVLQVADWLWRRLETHDVCMVCGVECGEGVVVDRRERSVEGGERVCWEKTRSRTKDERRAGSGQIEALSRQWMRSPQQLSSDWWRGGEAAGPGLGAEH